MVWNFFRDLNNQDAFETRKRSLISDFQFA